MCSAKHVTGTASALYRVFVLPSLSPTPPPLLLRRAFPTARPTSRRTLSTSSVRLAKYRPPEERRQKENNEITARLIYLPDPHSPTGALESTPRTRYDVLARLDQRTHKLIQVVPDEPGNWDFIPVCRIVSKKDEYEAQRRRKLALKEKRGVEAKAASVKTIELNWAIDGNDLSHRLEKLAEFLHEGRKVEVVLASKKRGRKAAEGECEDVLQRIRKVIDEVDGAKEAKEMHGRVGGFATLFFQGKVPEKGKEARESNSAL